VVDGRVTPPPQRRRTREELGELVLGAGVDLALEEGLGTGADHLTFKRVFERLEDRTGIRVTNASVIGRIWPSIEDYRREVLTGLSASDGGELLESIMGEVADLFASFDRRTPEARLASLAEAARVGANLSLGILAGSTMWRIRIGVWALAMTGSESGQLGPVRQAVAAAYAGTTAATAASNWSIARYLGFRPKPPGRIEEFSLAADALGEGYSLRLATGVDDLEPMWLPTGPDGELREWSLYALAVHALLLEFLELDPDWSPDDADAPVPRRRG
jgi:hypothetical protein